MSARRRCWRCARSQGLRRARGAAGDRPGGGRAPRHRAHRGLRVGQVDLAAPHDPLEEIDDGDILLDGEVITDPACAPVPVRRRLGLVFQALNLFPHLTVIQNVTPAPVRAGKAERADARARGGELLARFGLAGRDDDYPDRLCGDQQQRVAIVRALATRARALLLDEVTPEGHERLAQRG